MNTSQLAYIKVRPSARETRVKIMDFATKRGPRGFTVDELVEVWACSPNHVAPRYTELLKFGHLVATDRCRPTRAGATARVLIAAKFALWAEDRPAPAVTDSLFPDAPERYPD